MKVIIDMNLSPAWVECLAQAGFQASHWSALGDACAPDTVIMQYAREQEGIVFTHDLDFGAILAHTKAGQPSVLQVRARDVTPEYLGPLVIDTLRQFAEELRSGCLVTVDESRRRVRLLPLVP